MNSRERILLTLNHKEPDRVPYDLGGTVVTGIHIQAYTNLRSWLGLPQKDISLDHMYQQLARVDEDVLHKLGVDVRNICAFAGEEKAAEPVPSEDGTYLEFYDGYGIGWRIPADGGLYYDMFHHPLSGDITLEHIDSHPMPDPADSSRFEGLRTAAERILHEDQRALVAGNMSSGIFEQFLYTRGYMDGYMDWAGNQPRARRLLRRFADMQLAYWDKMFDTLAGLPVDVVEMSDDLAGQSNMLISPESYRQYLKPLHKEICDFIHSKSEAKIFLHSCGSVRPVIPDLIEAGFDILNPVQVNADGMDTAELKREFGSELVFWGGGVDTQSAFDARFSPAEVRSAVRSRLADLMPGGGFVFTPVHNIQANVPPQNIMAMWETLQEYGRY